MTLLFGIGAAVVVAAFIFFPGLRVMFKGLGNLFVEDLAKTPEGARAVYEQAIYEAQEEYNKANNTLQKIAGQLNTATEELKHYKEKLASLESKCEAFAKAGQFDKIDLYAQERDNTVEEVNSRIEIIDRLTPLFEEAKQINNHCETKLKQLQKDQKKVVNELQMNEQLKEMYDDMDELKNTTNTAKLLDAVKEGAKETREHAVGARVVHENKLSTKIDKADEEAKKLSRNSYKDELMKKYATQTVKNQ